jgi:hypothetical protein
MDPRFELGQDVDELASSQVADPSVEWHRNSGNGRSVLVQRHDI